MKPWIGQVKAPTDGRLLASAAAAAAGGAPTAELELQVSTLLLVPPIFLARR